jgi:sigma-B regulation protein RsbU (phosphoserine phosphatase)
MPRKILIVDDEPDMELLIRQRFRRQIRAGDYDFLFAANGDEALKLIRADPGIDLVLSDINMPIMDGLTLLRHLRGEQPRLGAVVVSAYGDMRNIRSAMNLGAFDFLTKPIDFQDFELTVEKTLRQVQELRQAEADRFSLVAVERDLETAAEIQRSFLPGPAPAPDCLSLHAAMLPARAVGGDFYDYFPLDGGRLALVIGDVAGKGVPAALLMAVTRTLVRATARLGDDPAACLRDVNRLLISDSPSSLFVSLFYGLLDTRTGVLRYAVGGHPVPYLLRAGGTVEPLSGRGFLVGMLPEAEFETLQVRVDEGDLLFLYTDGVTEARSPGGALFGEEGLEAALGAADRSSPEALVRAVIDAVQRFASPAAPSDDLTALALRYNGPGGW